MQGSFGVFENQQLPLSLNGRILWIGNVFVSRESLLNGRVIIPIEIVTSKNWEVIRKDKLLNRAFERREGVYINNKMGSLKNIFDLRFWLWYQIYY